MAAFIAALLFYGSLLWFLNWRSQKKLAAAFSAHPCAGPVLATISAELADLNEDCAHFVFTAERSGNIRFRANHVILVYGRVGSRSPGGIRGPVWTLRKTAYALVPQSQAKWMKSQSDVFTHAHSGYRYSIFWVNLDALLAG